MGVQRGIVPVAVMVLLAGCTAGGVEEPDARESRGLPAPDESQIAAVHCMDQTLTAQREFLISVLSDGSESAANEALRPYWEAAESDPRFSEALTVSLGQPMLPGGITARAAFEEIAAVCGATTTLTATDLDSLIDEHIGLLIDASATTPSAPYVRWEGADGVLVGESVSAGLTEDEQQAMIDDLFATSDGQPRSRAEEMEATTPPADVSSCLDGVWEILGDSFEATTTHVDTAEASVGADHPTTIALRLLVADGGAISMVGVDNACQESTD